MMSRRGSYCSLAGVLLVMLLSSSVISRADQVVLRDGRVLRGVVRRSGKTARVVTPLKTSYLPAGAIDHTEPDPGDPTAEENRCDRFATTLFPAAPEAPAMRRKRLDSRARPLRSGGLGDDGRWRRVLDVPDQGALEVEYAVVEVRPDRVVFQALAYDHRVELPMSAMSPRLILARLEAAVAADDAPGQLERARFCRLAGWLDPAEQALGAAERAGAEADAVARERERLKDQRGARSRRDEQQRRDRAEPFGGEPVGSDGGKAESALDALAPQRRQAAQTAMDALLESARGGDQAAMAAARRSVEALGQGPEAVDVLAWEALLRRLPDRAFQQAPDSGERSGRQQLEHPADGGVAVSYAVRLPRELGVGRRPLIIGLHGQGAPPEASLGFFGRLAERHGFVVAAPEFDVHPGEGYHHSWEEHRTVLMTIRDLVRRGLPIDPDRVFLAGHSLGGHATFDTALSHPDRFAGAAPFIGAHFAFGDVYLSNSRVVPIYVVDGEHDFDWPERNRKALKAMHKSGGDATYVEYAGRGHEGFGEELPALVDWMRTRRRDPYPLQMEWRAGRETDLRRFWVRIDRVAGKLPPAPVSNPGKPFVLPTVRAKVDVRRNAIDLRTKGVSEVTLLLSDGVVDLDRPVTVKVDGKLRHRGPLQRSLKVLLDDFMERWDASQTVTATLTVRLGR